MKFKNKPQQDFNLRNEKYNDLDLKPLFSSSWQINWNYYCRIVYICDIMPVSEDTDQTDIGLHCLLVHVSKKKT